MAKPILSQEYLKTIFDYIDGNLYWKNHKYNALNGKKAGTLNITGYWHINIANNQYKAHRLIFMIHHGYLPEFIDHIDGNRANNCIKNLRQVTKSQNAKNGKLRITNTSGVKNVTWYKRDSKWKVELRINNKLKSFGAFEDLELAELVAKEARNKYYGAYSRDK